MGREDSHRPASVAALAATNDLVPMLEPGASATAATTIGAGVVSDLLTNEAAFRCGSYGRGEVVFPRP
jgi:hypothetical protein